MTLKRFRLTNHANNAPEFNWKTQVDADIQALSVAAGFAAHEADTPNMTVVVDIGRIQSGITLTTTSSQTTGTIVAPVTNPRIDRIVMTYAGVISVVTGVEGASPSAPAIPASRVAVCQISLSVGQTRILNSNITDERPIYFVPNAFGDITAGLINGIGQPTLGTAQATTSGTSKDFDIPSWATQIAFPVDALSTNGTSGIILRLGDATSFEATGYMGSLAELTDATAVTATTFSTSFLLVTNNAAARSRYGSVILTLLDSSTNTWSAAINIGSDTTKSYVGGGTKSLTGPLTRIRLTTINGTDTFDAGKVNVRYS